MSKILPALLAARGMTQVQLADRTGIRREDINALCKGRKRLGATNGPKIARALGLDEDYFMAPAEPLPPEIEHLQQRVEDLLHDLAALRRRLQGGSP